MIKDKGSKKKIIFMGSAAFAVPALNMLYQARDLYEIIAVYTQPPRRQGRGKKLGKTPLHEIALTLDLPVFYPTYLKNNQEAWHQMREFAPDLLVVVAYGLILPQAFLDIPRFGAVNIHGSLLPKWRGAAPIQRAIEAGHSITGISLIKMDAGLDTGDVLINSPAPILEEDTSPILGERLARLGADMLLPCLKGLTDQALIGIKQEEEQATIAHKLNKQESWVDFSDEAIYYIRKLNAFTPWPLLKFGLLTEEIKLKKLRHIRLEEEGRSIRAGEILSLKPLIVACKKDALELEIVQRPSKNPCSGAELANLLGLELGQSLLA